MPDAVAGVGHPTEPLLAPRLAPRILYQPRLLLIVPADQDHDVVGLALAAAVEYAALIDAETGVAVDGHGERAVFDQSAFELGD